MKIKSRTRFIAEAGIIAALYAVLTLVFAPISYGEIQVRISEVLCVLPFFTPSAVPGLFIGCLVSNLLSIKGMIWADVVFGTLATLVGAIGAYLVGNLKVKGAIFLAPLPNVIANTIAVPLVIKYGYGSDFALPLVALFVFIGEVIACVVLGIPFGLAIGKIKDKIFANNKTKPQNA